MIYLALILALLVGGYVLLVRTQMKRDVAVRYNMIFARFLRFILPAQMRCLSLWTSAWLLYHPKDLRGKLSETGRKHELDGHLRNLNQWAGHPYSMPFRYLWLLLRFGYDKHPMEQEARRVAGEPER